MKPTKSERCISILSQCQTLDMLRRLGNELRVVAMDVGIANFAVAQFKVENMRLEHWLKLQVNDEGSHNIDINPRNTTMLSTSLGSRLWDQTPSGPTVFLLERQRLRTLSSRNVLEPVLRANILEHLLYAELSRRCDIETNRIVLSSDPRRMTLYWCGSASRTAEVNSKNVRIALVKGLLLSKNRPPLHIDLNADIRNKVSEVDGSSKFKLYNLVSQTSLGTKKDDDLADAFLHGLAWADWVRTFADMQASIMDKNMSFIQFQDFCKTKAEYLSALHHYALKTIS